MSKSLSSGTKLVSGAFEGEVMSRLPVSTCLIISTSPPSCMFGKISSVALPPVASSRCSAIIWSPRSIGSPAFWECPALSTMSAAPTLAEDRAPARPSVATRAAVSSLRMEVTPSVDEAVDVAVDEVGEAMAIRPEPCSTRPRERVTPPGRSGPRGPRARPATRFADPPGGEDGADADRPPACRPSPSPRG